MPSFIPVRGPESRGAEDPHALMPPLGAAEREFIQGLAQATHAFQVNTEMNLARFMGEQQQIREEALETLEGLRAQFGQLEGRVTVAAEQRELIRPFWAGVLVPILVAGVCWGTRH